MKKYIYAILIFALAGFIIYGCGHHHKKARIYNFPPPTQSTDVAPVGTINVVYRGNFTPDELVMIDESITTINNYFSTEIHNDFNVIVEINSNPIEDCEGTCVHVVGDVIIIYVGEYFECPELYEHLCHTQEDPDLDHRGPDWEGWRNRGHYISCQIAKARGGPGRPDCPDNE